MSTSVPNPLPAPPAPGRRSRRFVVTLEGIDAGFPDPVVRLRKALKALHRVYDLTALEIQEQDGTSTSRSNKP